MMPFGLITPGNLHILDGIMRTITESLPLWNWAKGLLKHLSLFLHKHDSRKRLQERCCASPETNIFRSYFNNAVCPKLIEHRWEVVVNCCDGCLFVKQALQFIWSKESYQRSGGEDAAAADHDAPKRDDDEEEKISVDKVSEAIGSSKFWGLCYTIQKLSK
eukprot:217290-Pyramimonas_sp.AAC.1